MTSHLPGLRARAVLVPPETDPYLLCTHICFPTLVYLGWVYPACHLRPALPHHPGATCRPLGPSLLSGDRQDLSGLRGLCLYRLRLTHTFCVLSGDRQDLPGTRRAHVCIRLAGFGGAHPRDVRQEDGTGGTNGVRRQQQQRGTRAAIEQRGGGRQFALTCWGESPERGGAAGEAGIFPPLLCYWPRWVIALRVGFSTDYETEHAQ